MRFSVFTKTCTAHQSRLEQINLSLDALLTVGKVLSEVETNKLKLLLNETKSLHNSLDKNINKLHSSDETSDDYDEPKVIKFYNEISDLCINIESKITPLLPQVKVVTLTSDNPTTVQPTTASATSSSVRLPKIELKTFSGNANEWISYINLFDTTINSNTSLTLVEKQQYLISSLSGEALDLVKSLPISSGNYLVAYNALRDRYHSVRRLVTLHLNKIIDLPNITDNPNTSNQLRQFLNEFNENEQALNALNCIINDQEHPNLLLSTLLLRKLDASLRKGFESSRGSSSEMPTSSDIIKFLKEVCNHSEDATLNSTQSPKVFNRPTHKSTNAYVPPHRTGGKSFSPRHASSAPVSFVTTNYTKCFCCNDVSHNIYGCPEFNKKLPHDRLNIVQATKRCVNCFGNHTTQFCKSKQRCKHCNKSHHSLLHFFNPTSKFNRPSIALDNSREEKLDSHNTSSSQTTESKTVLVCENSPVTFNRPSETSSTVLLATTLVKVKSPSGISHVFRGIIDSASQSTFLTERAAQLLHVNRIKSPLAIDGISCTSTKTKGLAYLNIETLNGALVVENHPILILEKITSSLPRTQVHPDVKLKAKNFSLADPTFDKSGPIDILIGGELFAKIFTGNNFSLGQDLPDMVSTVFGYVLIGRAACIETCHRPITNNFLTTLLTVNELNLHNQLQRFWQQEEPPQYSKLSDDELYCEEHFAQTHSRNEEGRYILKLPFKPNHSKLGSSYDIAKQRLFSVEKRFQSQPQFKQQYVEFMDDYVESGHMTKCDMIHPPLSEHCVLGHHGIIKETSSTTRLRVVFDASMKTSNKLSLNDILLPGPKLQTNVSDILMNFRKYNFVFSCDIRQMYRQILIHPDDQNYQLILWRKNYSEPISLYKLLTLTYGTNCAPFLAIRTLKQLAQDESSKFPEAANILLHQTFMDDCTGGHDTEQEALELRNQLIELLRNGKFELRKWTSNSSKLLEDIPKEFHEVPMFMHESDEQAHYKILGLHWSSVTDTFSYNFKVQNLPSPNAPTKRQVLSIIAQIFDPVGFLSPIIMKAKCFMQTLWIKNLDWDDILPLHLATSWNNFIQQLSCTSEIKIPRSLCITKGCTIQLHGFADASLHGYACVVYIRSVIEENQIIVRQLISKTRLAPLKSISLPRLELSASHILSKLMSFCVNIFSTYCHVEKIFNWCDSTIVLSWISTPPYRLKTFVSNRVAEIQELTPRNSWYHVKSAENPADCASRGIFPSELKNHPLWFSGPDWLSLPSYEWPKSRDNNINQEDIPDLKSEPLTFITTSVPEQTFEILERISSWPKIKGVFAYVLRFIYNCQHSEKLSGLLQLKELQNAEVTIFKIVQNSSFSEDITALRKNKTCSTRLLRLAPFLDNEGILRVGGRLKHSSLDYNCKYPILLPKSHHIVNIIIDFYHVSNLHAGPQLLQSLIFQRFWILSARSIIRSRIFKCIRCFRCKPKNFPPLMGDLPSPRVNHSKPFLSTGIDFCGPFNAKAINLRSSRVFKIYVCVFICFATKAVHLEVVTDMSTSAFIAALHRFTSRRGLPAQLYSDCGSNFLGADAHLKNVVKSFFSNEENRKQIHHFANHHTIEFNFNPPATPHQGGLWESAVKSFKYHFIHVVGQEVLTVEEFFTLTAKIESILNSRPLTPISSDPSDLTALTPGHFLIGSTLVSVPEENVSDIPLNRLKRWQRVQAFTQNIWRRWSIEYLHTLQQRSKWLLKGGNLKVGDLVIVQDTSYHPLSWPLGRIVSISPGKDGIVRVVQVKTQTGCYTRPAVKVFPLPISD